ncbi:dTDP-4-dehydrorhamnose reductase [Candidatus Gracilibacteria bacterium]|nr:dTDP-4-dehydrorhamnose reductase [Candidatus Gracilibacteria bacterium]
MKKKILITGKNGMLASEFLEKFGDNEKFQIFAFDKKELDITKFSEIEKKVFVVQPDIILNFSAYTNVDDAEDIGEGLNFAVNFDGVENLAKISGKNKIDFITISTDFVFDGENENGYSEKDFPNPTNQYGFAKFLGEKSAKEFNENSIIIRTSWLYGGGKKFKNFVNTMLNLGEKLEKGELKKLKIIADQFGNPTYCGDLADGIFKVLENIEKYRGKIFHFSNEISDKNNKKISWFDFAEEIFLQSGKKIGENVGNIKKISVSEYKRKARTPKFSILKNNSEIKIGDWKIGLKKYFEKIL